MRCDSQCRNLYMAQSLQHARVTRAMESCLSRVALLAIVSCSGSAATVLDGGSDAPLSDAARLPDAAPSDGGMGCSCSTTGLIVHATFSTSEECVIIFSGYREVYIEIAGMRYFPEGSPGNGLACAVPGQHENWFGLSWPETIHDGDTILIVYDGSSDQSHATGQVTIIAATASCQLTELPVSCSRIADAGVNDAGS